MLFTFVSTMNWLSQLLSQPSIPQTVIVYGLAIAAGIWLGKIRVFGISLGVTWILFLGLLISYTGIQLNPETEHFLKEFGLILFVYSIGLQVGPGFFSALKQNAAVTNGLAAAVVILGVTITVIFFYASDTAATTVTGVMSGAVTNTPGLGAAQDLSLIHI